MAGVAFVALPISAAWQHQQARRGFEVVHFHTHDSGYVIRGCTTAVEDAQAWTVDYEIELDAAWNTRHARITGRSAGRSPTTTLEGDGAGHWLVDGEAAPHLDGCLDVDLESSAMTNTLPVHRMRLAVGEQASAPAVYVRALTLDTDRLEQTYRRADNQGSHEVYDYSAPVFDFGCHLVYDESGLLLTYPGIAVRVL
ncbi:putative glycolipid-binding domain-containing protein [Nocardia cyriacigeorgica]|uniref:Putative glycolipid-binding domain-containing protein n=1 Tax=Nocardia cyriacigeorgica TaxID=135487 RepID=A0A6P1DDP7_9NOCA|nr:putative glycolipid-binding domain-containing protein [Nocardia cyriacigeorgica]NEW46733.1 putative glycolipid-binding domain-containing protein [Nocardia cyriacigeorgica]